MYGSVIQGTHGNYLPLWGFIKNMQEYETEVNEVQSVNPQGQNLVFMHIIFAKVSKKIDWGNVHRKIYGLD